MTAADIGTEFSLRHDNGILFLTLASGDRMNRLTRRKVIALQKEIEGLVAVDSPVPPLVISGTPIFSAGADLRGTAFRHEGRNLSTEGNCR